MTRILLLVFLLSNIALAKGELKVSEISQRTGHELDNYERGYFRLFNDAAGYRSAEFFTDDDSNMVVKINFTEGHAKPDSTFTIKKEIAKQIKFYIENYELLNSEDNSGYKFDQAVWTYIKPGTRYYKNDIKWHDLHNKLHVSTLLYVDSLYFVVQDNDEDYNWQYVKDSVVIVYYDQVLAVNSQPVKSNNYKEVVYELKGKASFSGNYKDDYQVPRELKEFISDQWRIFTPKASDGKLSAQESGLDDKLGGIFLGIRYGYYLTLSNNVITLLARAMPPYDGFRQIVVSYGFPDKNISAYFEKSLWNNRNFVGGEVVYLPEPTSNNNDVSASCQGLKAYYKYYQQVYLGYEGSLFKNINLTYSLGVTYLSIDVKDQLDDIYYPYKSYSVNSHINEIGYNFTFGTLLNFSRVFGLTIETDLYFSPDNYSPIYTTRPENSSNDYYLSRIEKGITLTNLNTKIGFSVNL